MRRVRGVGLALLLMLCSTAAAEPFGYWSEAVLDDADMKQAVRKGLRRPAQWAQYAETQHARAATISKALEQFVRAWLVGKNDGRIPAGLLPPGLDNEKLGGWRVVDPDRVRPEQQWWVRPTHPIDLGKLYFLYPDNHCTYAKLAFIAPFGSRLHLAGEFPRARFFDLQISGPYDPKNPASVGFGAGEVPIVDADIEPRAGHVNPFRIGAERRAAKREYEVEFLLTAGNAAVLNPSFRPPSYRGRGNRRVGGPFRDAGPAFEGRLHPGILWMRSYLPDRGTGPNGGVALPRAWMTLPTGERFWIAPKSLELVRERQNTTVRTRRVASGPADPSCDGRWGWMKGFGIALTGLEMGFRRSLVDAGPLKQGIAKGVIRSIDGGLFNRGADRPPPGRYAVTATGCSYIHYLHRDVAIEPGHVVAITGRLPGTPRTGDGQARMEKADARYWSIVHYDVKYEGHPGVLMGSLCDEDVVRDDGWFCIVYGRVEDRPKNARTANGVTFDAWGPVGRQLALIRWLSVADGWEDPEITPHETNAPWTTCSWSSRNYDSAQLGLNRRGLLGPCHPIVHSMSRAEFEELGQRPERALRKAAVWR